MAMRAPCNSRLHSGETRFMSFSLETISAETLKSEAKQLRDQRARNGQPITHSAALEQVAQAHGYRDWNTARAALPDRVAVPFQVGMRVRGRYLEQPFVGVLVGVQLAGNRQFFTVTVLFDAPVNVTPPLCLPLTVTASPRRWTETAPPQPCAVTASHRCGWRGCSKQEPAPARISGAAPASDPGLTELARRYMQFAVQLIAAHARQCLQSRYGRV
jgi:hypothetical protein